MLNSIVVMDMSSHFFTSGPFMPHGGCYLWTTSLIALHAIADALIVLAYYSIPVTLVYFVRRRRDLKFHWMFVCFAVFILACGTTHLMEIWNIWHANYWLSGSIKAITALASVPTAILLVKLIPQALALPSPGALHKAYGELEQRVVERTRQLEAANETLKREVQERQRAEQQLQNSFKEISDLKAALDEHAIVAITDPQGKITYVNDKFCAISRYAREELLGRDHRLINSGYHSKEFIRNLWATIMRGRVWKGEIKNRAKDGSFYWVDTTIVPFLNKDDKPRQYVAIRADITERKQAEVRLRESEQRFATMANSIPQLAWIARADGFILWYNQRWYEYTGTTAEQMEGWGWQSVHDPQLLPEVMAKWKVAIAAGRPFEMEFPLRGADECFRRFLTRAQPFLNASGQVEQWFGTNTDVDELKRVEAEIKTLNAELEQRVAERTAELEAANKDLEAFSYSVSHDLRAPLRAVNGFAGIVLEDFGRQIPEEGRRHLERIRNGGQRMGRLIDDLLAFSRLNRQSVNRQSVDSARLVREALDELKPQREGRQLELRIAELPPCQADPALLKQVWVNLLSNAIKYSRDRAPAVVEIGARQEERENVFFVRDNGAGFDMQYGNKLFGVFQRLHRADQFEGTGVGLAIVQRIVQRHGGRVWAEGKVDQGATFYFTLEGENKP